MSRAGEVHAALTEENLPEKEACMKEQGQTDQSSEAAISTPSSSLPSDWLVTQVNTFPLLIK